jgi:hypothetical protein
MLLTLRVLVEPLGGDEPRCRTRCANRIRQIRPQLNGSIRTRTRPKRPIDAQPVGRLGWRPEPREVTSSGALNGRNALTPVGLRDRSIVKNALQQRGLSLRLLKPLRG